jgi:HPt (histidine-containing phosphotransfer) domain-containing protein
VIEDLRARFLPAFVAAARERIVHALESLSTGRKPDAGLVARELHALAGEAAVLGVGEVATLARQGEAAARRWCASGNLEDEAACARSLYSLTGQVETLAARIAR